MIVRKFIIILAALLSVALIGRWLMPEKAAPVNTVKAMRGTLTETALAVGNIMPLHSISVTSSMAGTVARLFHDEGDFVKKGEPLVELQPNPTPSDLDKAMRDMQTKAVAEQNELAHLTRYKNLLKQDFITQDDYDNAAKNYETAKLARQLAEEQLAILQQGKALVAGKTIQSVIISPIDGYILSRQIDVGDPIVPQTSYQTGRVLFTIANMRDLIFQGQVNEIDVGKLHEGMPAELTLSALPDNKIKGRLIKIALESAQLDNKNNQSANDGGQSNNPTANSPFNVGFNVKIADLNIPAGARLRAGYSANADIIIKRAAHVLMLPERVIEFRDNKNYVWLPGQKPKEHAVTLGISDGINVEIVSGLKEGQEVLDGNPNAKITNTS